jgi:tripartite-type tricarboxylate transporter receptor subunit TctC
MRKRLSFAACAALLAAATAPVVAQGYPAKPVRYVVPMSAGSGADTIGRIVSGGLTTALGQQVIVDNRTGAAGNIGADHVAKAPPDGYTVFQASMTHTTNVSLYSNLTYDLVRDFVPVTLLATSPSAFVVHPSLPAKSVAELVKLAKSRPGQMNYASTGLGSATFLAAEMFKQRAGIDLLHVPYRGGGESLASVVTGETSVYIGPLPAMMSLIKQGRLRALAVTTPARVAAAPELPTMGEAGYPGYETGNWYGMLVPAKTPKEVITTLHNAALAALKNPQVMKRMTDLGYIAIGNTPEQFGAHIRSEIDKLAKILAPLKGSVKG